MADPNGIYRERIEQRFTAVRDTVRTESRRTAAECQAYETFADRVADIDCPGPRAGQAIGTVGQGGTVAPGASAIARGQTAPAEAIRRAYEETVMAVSFYEDEYGDDYPESLRGEFGLEIATAVTDPDCFGPAAKAALLSATDRAIQERTHLVETCERERASVDTAADSLLPLAAELDTLAAIDPTGDPFGALEARWHRLATLRDRCEDAAAERQADINDGRSRHDLPVDEPDICAYLYKDLDVNYPVLAICASLGERATAIRDREERAMALY